MQRLADCTSPPSGSSLLLPCSLELYWWRETSGSGGRRSFRGGAQNTACSESAAAPGPAELNVSARGADASVLTGEERVVFFHDWPVWGRIALQKHQKEKLASAPRESLFRTSDASTQVCEARWPLACHALWI